MDARSEKNLVGVHPDLVKVVRSAAKLSEVPFVVIDGVRSLERQRELVKKGASRTMDSRHLTGHAFDVAVIIDGKYISALAPYRKVWNAIRLSAKALNIPVEWGGDWKGFVDAAHFQLPKSEYP